MSGGTERAVFRAADAALKASIARDYDTAKFHVESIARDHGSEYIVLAVQAWVDAVAVHHGFDGSDGKTVARPMVISEGSGGIDEAPLPVRVAMRLITARLAFDKPAFSAHVKSVPNDREWGAVVGMVVQICGDTIRGDKGFLTNDPAVAAQHVAAALGGDQ